MATSHYFRNYASTKTNEQFLTEDLIVESIKIMGHDMQYLPREIWEETDTLFGENTQSIFRRAYSMEMYIENVMSSEGDREIFTKFGLELRDNSRFTVAKRTFNRYVPTTIASRPREGDLIYVPLLDKIFEIKFVEEDKIYFQNGIRNHLVYELRCEAFRYNNEKIDTGIDAIDAIDDNMKYTVELSVASLQLSNTQNDYILGEIVYQGANLEYANATARVSNWISTNNKLYIIESNGEFTTGNVTGVTSNTSSRVVIADTLGDYVMFDTFENKEIQIEANTFINLDDNPFGTP